MSALKIEQPTEAQVSPVSPVVRPRLASIPNAAIYTATSRAKLYTEHKAGNISFIKLDGATRVEFEELDRWIDVKTQRAVAS